jgi:hypothetical protein
MKSRSTVRIRETVYVIGAGFSFGLGYPLTKSLLIDAWDWLPADSKDQLEEIIKFHHPAFKLTRTTSFPNIEQLLTEMVVNLQMFNASRPAEGRFTKKQLAESYEILLFAIATWFHELYKKANKTKWLPKIIERLRHEDAAIVSFNWDLILDHVLFGGALNSANYGLSSRLGDGPVLLKPHGSLNWYEGTQLEYVKDAKRVKIVHSSDATKCVHAFLRPRGVKSTAGKRYTPLIIPPTYLKDFTPTIFQQLWRTCTDVLSTPKRLIFLGYSLPAADLHAQFIFRCGFYNQLNGRLRDGGGRYPATGAAEVIIVDPDQDAARRIEAVAGPAIPCEWIPKRVEDWLA